MFPELTAEQIQKRYECAREQYKAIGVDTDAALDKLGTIPDSIHCWQGDDVRGFEVHDEAVTGGGIMSTGNYPGPALDAATLRKDAEKAFSLIPGVKRFNIHAIYGSCNTFNVAFFISSNIFKYKFVSTNHYFHLPIPHHYSINVILFMYYM